MFLDFFGFFKGERGEEREKVKKKEKAIDCFDWKLEVGFFLLRKKREEFKDRYFFWDGEKGVNICYVFC